MNDIVSSQSKPGWWGRLRGIVALRLLPTGQYRDKPFSGLVVGASDRHAAAVEPWFAEAGALVNAVRHETGSFVLSHPASTQSRMM